MKKLTIHMIGNAHLDPVWLWRKSAGLDEALATCRTACDLLDEYPDLTITRGEAWVYEQVRIFQPAVFARIQAQVRAGRWEIVNGWWIQPDCNLPTAASFHKQAELGQAWFQRHFGVHVKVGYNVDSFGHTASMPMFLQAHGMDSYCFMRPGPHEKKLPANLFRWRSADGSEVLAYRNDWAYCSDSVEFLNKVLDETIKNAAREVGHAMCFYGVGDHGGGPTRAQVEWILAHRRYRDDVELAFSTPQRFFDAVAPLRESLPRVQDELQIHAIGCYSAEHGIKQRMRQAERLCERAEGLAGKFPADAPANAVEKLDGAWRQVLFNQFHDILAGSSIRSACVQAQDELGAAVTAARELIEHVARRRTLATPPCEFQRMAVCNTGAQAYTGPLAMTPWIPNPDRHKPVALFGGGRELVFQRMENEYALRSQEYQLVVDAQIPAHGLQEYQVRYQPPVAAPSGRFVATPGGLQAGDLALSLTATGGGEVAYRGQAFTGAMRIEVRADESDTWSHGLAQFDGAQVATFTAAAAWKPSGCGPLFSAAYAPFTAAPADAWMKLTAFAGIPVVRIKLRVNWIGRHRIVKLVIPAAFRPVRRTDRIAGGEIERALNGHELPFCDCLTLAGADRALSVISPDVYSVDVQPDGAIRLTLLRCPPYAHHEPLVLESSHPWPYMDQGTHEYEIGLVLHAGAVDAAQIDAEIYRLSNPLHGVETTVGMPPRQGV